MPRAFLIQVGTRKHARGPRSRSGASYDDCPDYHEKHGHPLALSGSIVIMSRPTARCHCQSAYRWRLYAVGLQSASPCHIVTGNQMNVFTFTASEMAEARRIGVQ